MSLSLRLGPVEVWWLGGGLYVEAYGNGVLVDTPEGVAARLEELGASPRLRAVLLTSGRPLSVGGLVPLLCSLERHRDRESPLSVLHSLVEERAALLAGAWVRGWPGSYPLHLDGFTPGDRAELGALSVRTRAVRHGEPRWGEAPAVAQRPALAVRLELADHAIAFVPGAAPGSGVERLCDGADLAVVEVGRAPRPRTDRAWRRTAGQATEAAGGAKAVWLVGDDGRAATEPTVQ